MSGDRLDDSKVEKSDIFEDTEGAAVSDLRYGRTVIYHPRWAPPGSWTIAVRVQ